MSESMAIARVRFLLIDGTGHWEVRGGGQPALAVEKSQAHARANKRNIKLLERVTEIIQTEEWNSDLRQVLLDELGVTE